MATSGNRSDIEGDEANGNKSDINREKEVSDSNPQIEKLSLEASCQEFLIKCKKFLLDLRNQDDKMVKLRQFLPSMSVVDLNNILFKVNVFRVKAYTKLVLIGKEIQSYFATLASGDCEIFKKFVVRAVFPLLKSCREVLGRISEEIRRIQEFEIVGQPDIGSSSDDNSDVLWTDQQLIGFLKCKLAGEAIPLSIINVDLYGSESPTEILKKYNGVLPYFVFRLKNRYLSPNDSSLGIAQGSFKIKKNRGAMNRVWKFMNRKCAYGNWKQESSVNLYDHHNKSRKIGVKRILYCADLVYKMKTTWRIDEIQIDEDNYENWVICRLRSVTSKGDNTPKALITCMFDEEEIMDNGCFSDQELQYLEIKICDEQLPKHIAYRTLSVSEEPTAVFRGIPADEPFFLTQKTLIDNSTWGQGNIITSTVIYDSDVPEMVGVKISRFIEDSEDKIVLWKMDEYNSGTDLKNQHGWVLCKITPILRN